MDEKLKPYAAFLEDIAEKLIEYQPKKVVLCAILPNVGMMTAYFGEVGAKDKVLIANSIHSDAIMDMVCANAGMIIRAAEEQEGQDND